MTEDSFITFYKECYGMKNKETLRFLASNSAERAFAKKEYISQAGFLQPILYILDSGVVRGISMNGDKESTDCIVSERGTVLCTTPFPSAKEPAQIGLQALTDCHVVGIPTELIEKNLMKYPEITKVALYMAKQSVASHAQISRVRTMRAEERIGWMRENYAEVMDEINDECIASYLGMTREHYCKMKAEM